MKRIFIYTLCALVLMFAAVTALRLARAKSFDFASYTDLPRPPQIVPDYAQIVIPPNIAPLNFVVREEAAAYCVRISSTAGEPIEVRSETPSIAIPLQPWRKLLAANAGESLLIDVFTRSADDQWQKFATIRNTIAREEIDSYLAYRLIPPIHHKWRKIGIYQRNLEDFVQTTVVENRNFGRNGCVNCHTFKQNSAQSMSFQIRSPDYGLPMMLVRDGEIRKVDTRAGKNISPASYHTWHPSGELIAFARIKPAPFEHTVGDARDVWDADSDLGVYFIDKNRVAAPPAIAAPDRRETWPSWSSDGRHLYFCSAPQVPFTKFGEVRYDLMRVSYDKDTNIWGAPEVLVAASESGLSAGEPRESPDGRWLLFCLCKYGNFPVFQPSSDLYVMDMQTREYRKLEINSPVSDSWHSWSSNGRWVAFASKRDAGLLSRVHFSYVDESGTFQRPFVLPQQDPQFYDSFLLTFNVPELVKDLVPVTRSQLGRAITSPDRIFRAEHESDIQETATAQEQAKLAPGPAE